MKKWTALLVLLALVELAPSLRADFSSYYAFPDNHPPASGFSQTIFFVGAHTLTAGTWTISSNNDGITAFGGNGYPTVNADPSQLVMGAGGLFSGPHFGDLQVLNTAPAAGLFSFDFSLTLGTASVSHAYYLINGTQFALSAGTGSVSVFLNAGDTFGFREYIEHASIPLQLFPDARLVVTNFSAPIPEPSAVALLALGAVACGVAAIRRLDRVKSGSESERATGQSLP